MNQFSDAVAHEKLDSDEEDLDTFAEPPKHKYAACASNISGSAALLTLSLIIHLRCSWWRSLWMMMNMGVSNQTLALNMLDMLGQYSKGEPVHLRT